MGSIRAPWDEKTVQMLNKFQAIPIYHEYTCGGEDCREPLVATADGWVCKKCHYTQTWAFDAASVLVEDFEKTKSDKEKYAVVARIMELESERRKD